MLDLPLLCLSTEQRDAANHLMTSSGDSVAANSSFPRRRTNWQRSPVSWKRPPQLLHRERSGLTLWAAWLRSDRSPSSWATWRRLSGQVRQISQCHLSPWVTRPRPRAASPLIQSGDTEASWSAAPRQAGRLRTEQLWHATSQQWGVFELVGLCGCLGLFLWDSFNIFYKQSRFWGNNYMCKDSYSRNSTDQWQNSRM